MNIIPFNHFFENPPWMIGARRPLDGWIIHFCSTVNSLSGCFLTAGSVDNDGALCRTLRSMLFPYISSGKAALITQRCCILCCFLKYNCHVVKWRVMMSFLFLPLLIWSCDLGHSWNPGTPEGRTKWYYIPPSINYYFIVFLFWGTLYIQHWDSPSSHQRQSGVKASCLASVYESGHALFGHIWQFSSLYQKKRHVCTLCN